MDALAAARRSCITAGVRGISGVPLSQLSQPAEDESWTATSRCRPSDHAWTPQGETLPYLRTTQAARRCPDIGLTLRAILRYTQNKEHSTEVVSVHPELRFHEYRDFAPGEMRRLDGPGNHVGHHHDRNNAENNWQLDVQPGAGRLSSCHVPSSCT